MSPMTQFRCALWLTFLFCMLFIVLSIFIHGWHRYLFIYLAGLSAMTCVTIAEEYGKYRVNLQSINRNNDALSTREGRNNALSMSESVHYTPDSQINMPLGTIAETAVRSLPPVKSFDSDQNKDCPICIEEFEKGELIQSFGVCVHEFHISCLKSWLLGGKTTCPVCRHDLFI